MSGRLKRTTSAQYEELLSFVEHHKVLLHGKTSPQDVGVIKKLWQQFADHVNALGLGPCKTAEQWKKVCLPEIFTHFSIYTGCPVSNGTQLNSRFLMSN